MENKIKAQPLGFADLFSQGWQLYSTYFINILWVLLWVYIPINLIMPLLPVNWYLLGGEGTSGPQLSIQLAQLFKSMMGIIATMGIAVIVSQGLHGETMAWYTALRYSLSKLLTAIGTWVLGLLIIMGLTLLLIIPGLIQAFYYTFSIYAVALRNVGGKTALDYSKRLVQGQWWRIFGIVLLFNLIAQFIGLAVTFLMRLIADNFFWDTLTKTITDIVGAYFTVVMAVLFLNSDFLKHE